MPLMYLPGVLPQAATPVSVPDPNDAVTPNKLAAIPAIQIVDQSGNAAGSGTTASPTVSRAQGASSFATSQAASSVSPAAANQIVAARSGRQAVTFSNITGSQPVYFLTSNDTNGTTTGFFLAGTVGASVTISTQAAIFATSPTAAQTISVLETF